MIYKQLLFLVTLCFIGDAAAGSYSQNLSQQPRYKSRPHQHYVRYKQKYRPMSSYKTKFLPERLYVGASLGHTMPIGFELNPGAIKDSRGTATYGLLFGTDIFQWLRVGIDLTHQFKHTIKDTQDKSNLSAQIKQTTVMLNSYFMIPHDIMKPYLLIGVGLSWNGLYNYHVNGKQSSFPGSSQKSLARQIGAGITFPYKNFALDGEIKYANKGKVSTKHGVGSLSGEQPRKGTLEDMVFTISARYYFNEMQ